VKGTEDLGVNWFDMFVTKLILGSFDSGNKDNSYDW